MRRYEMNANAAPQDPNAQLAYISALLEYGLPGEVLKRVDSGMYAVNAAIVERYATAWDRHHGLSSAESHAVRARLSEAWRAYGNDGENYIQAGRLRAAAAGAAGAMPYGGAGVSHGHGGYGMGMGPAAGGAGYVGGMGMGMSMPVSPAPASLYSSVRDTLSSRFGTPSEPVHVRVVEPKPSGWTIALSLARFVFWGGLLYITYKSMSAGPAGAGITQLLGGDEKSAEVVDVPTTRFVDVRGCDEAKQELQDVVAFLRNPEKYRRLGAKVPRGVLLTGPPGTGKTLLARAVAGEAGCKFYSKSASEFEEMLVGLGARRVRELFAAARKNSPAIIFIDEIDAMGGKRKVSIGADNRQTLNQLLACMDGFSKNENVIVIAATNMVDILDPALIRPGRFDTTVQVPLPDVKGREDILRLYLGKVVVEPGIDAGLLARATPGFSGAQIEAMINSAALMAANRNADRVEMCDIEEARDKVIMGPGLKSRVKKPETMELTAYHEGGHALVRLLTPETNPLHKATILPRGSSGGATYHLPKDEDYKTRVHILAEIDVAMGGRAAEELKYGKGKVTTGAGSDMQQATNLARTMVQRLAMSDLGFTSYGDLEELSQDRRRQLDAEVERILQESYARVYKLLETNYDKLKLLAGALLEHETLSAEECRDVIEGKKLPPATSKASAVKQPERKAEPVAASAGPKAVAGGGGAAGGAAASSGDDKDKRRARLDGIWGPKKEHAPEAGAASSSSTVRTAIGTVEPATQAAGASAGAAAGGEATASGKQIEATDAGRPAPSAGAAGGEGNVEGAATGTSVGGSSSGTFVDGKRKTRWH